MARRLIERGLAVTGWDRDPEAVGRAVHDGVAAASSARAAAASAEVVLTSVTEDGGVRELFRGPDGFLSGVVRGKLFIEMSTLQPATVRELAPTLQVAGARIVDAPVLGTIPSARSGELVALAGGEPDDLDRAETVLAHLTKRVFRMGPLGCGHVMKLTANLGLAAYIQALAEGLALGAQEGLEMEQMLEVLGGGTVATPYLKMKSPVFAGAPAEMTLDIRTLRKDMMSAVASGARNGVPMPLTSGTLAALSAAVGAGHGAADIAEIPYFFREDAIQRWPTPDLR